MKKLLKISLVFFFLSSSLSPLKAYASLTTKNNEIKVGVTEEIALFQLANLKIDDLLYILSSENIDPETVFTAAEINAARVREGFGGRAGLTKIVKVSNTRRDIYINSYIATTLKYVGFASIGKYISGFPGLAVGSIGANIKTSNGIIIRYQR